MSRKRLIIGQRLEHLPFGTINGTMDDVDRLAAQIGQSPNAAQWGLVDGCHVLVCLALNTSEEDLVERAPAGVVRSGLEMPDLDPDTDGGDVANDVVLGPPAIEIEPPDSGTENWVITLVPIPAGQTGLVVLLGLVKARVDVTSASHKFATFQSGEAVYLKSDAAGAKIWDRKLIEEEGDGTLGKQWALVMVGGGSGGGGGGATLMILAADCEAAHGDLTSGVIGVKVLASFASYAFDGDDLVITRDAGEPVPVWNLDPGKTYLENQGVYVSDGTAGGTTFRKIDSSNCSIYVEGS